MKFIAKFAVREAEQSPSARRAWVEIAAAVKSSTLRNVALRKEGVG